MKYFCTTTLHQSTKPSLLKCYQRFNAQLVSGKGCYVQDLDSKEYLDFTSGIAVNSLGHAHPVILNAIHEASQGILHVSNLFHTTAQTNLADRLINKSSMDQVFLCNSGTEANEAALKFAARYNPERTKLIAFKNGFHGRTIGSLSVTHKPSIRQPFSQYLHENVTFLDLNDIAQLTNNADDQTCAIIVEPVQGEGGVHVASNEFLQSLRRICTEKSIVLIFDEVQTGCSRTGRIWNHSRSSISPDILTAAKPLAGGLPIGACMLKDFIAQRVLVGDHGTTFGGNPFVSHVACAVFDELTKPELISRVAENGTYLAEQLESLPLVSQVRTGGGLLIGIQMRTKKMQKIMNECLDNGLLLLSAGPDTLRICPPLIITKRELDKGLSILEDVLSKQ